MAGKEFSNFHRHPGDQFAVLFLAQLAGLCTRRSLQAYISPTESCLVKLRDLPKLRLHTEAPQQTRTSHDEIVFTFFTLLGLMLRSSLVKDRFDIMCHNCP